MSALLFLCKKNFHPGRNQNKKKVWLAEQEAAQREQKERERNKLVNEENQRNTLKYGSSATASLDFMYAPPPGYVGEKERQQLEQRKKEKEERDAQQQQQQQRQQLSRREREKKEAEERPEDRFSFLKNAPVHGNASNVPMAMVTSFKPLGIEIRNVRCLRCKQWGHSKGDKVCTMQQLKIEKDEHQQAREDPLRGMGAEFSRIGDTGLSLRVNTLGRAMNNPNDVNQQLLDSDDEDEGDLEQQFLASLTKAQKRKLLRHFKREERRKQRQERRKERGERPDNRHHTSQAPAIKKRPRS